MRTFAGPSGPEVVTVDYDPQSWLEVPHPEVMPIDVWARTAAARWGADLDASPAWRERFEQDLRQVGAIPDLTRWDAAVLHVDLDARGVPTLVPVDIAVFPAEHGPGGVRGWLLDPTAKDLVEAPRAEELTAPDGTPVLRVVRYRHGVRPDAAVDHDSVSLHLAVLRRLRDDADLLVSVTSPDLGRTLALADELVALSGQVSLVPALS